MLVACPAVTAVKNPSTWVTDEYGNHDHGVTVEWTLRHPIRRFDGQCIYCEVIDEGLDLGDRDEILAVCDDGQLVILSKAAWDRDVAADVTSYYMHKVD